MYSCMYWILHQSLTKIVQISYIYSNIYECVMNTKLLHTCLKATLVETLVWIKTKPRSKLRKKQTYSSNYKAYIDRICFIRKIN